MLQPFSRLAVKSVTLILTLIKHRGAFPMCSMKCGQRFTACSFRWKLISNRLLLITAALSRTPQRVNTGPVCILHHSVRNSNYMDQRVVMLGVFVASWEAVSHNKRLTGQRGAGERREERVNRLGQEGGNYTPRQIAGWRFLNQCLRLGEYGTSKRSAQPSTVSLRSVNEDTNLAPRYLGNPGMS